METEKKAESVFYKIGFTVLISIVGFFCMQYAMKLNEIQKQIANLQVEVVKIQSQLISRSEIKELIKDYHENHPYYKEQTK